MKNIVGVLDLPVCPSVPWQPNSAEQPGSFTLHTQRNGSSNMNLGDFSKGGGIAGNPLLLRNVICFLFGFTEFVLTKERAENSQIPRLLFS